MRTLTKELRDKITPLQAFEILKEGNHRFINNLKLNRNLLQQINETSDEQHPFAVILSCIDSRTSAELIFDQGLGDIFSIRIAGNIINDDIIGSMEFGCKIAGAKIILVLGHTRCGAVKGACDNLQMGYISKLLDKLQPAVSAETNTIENRTSNNEAFVEHVAEINVRKTVDAILGESETLRRMVDACEIGIGGAMYNIQTGEVEFYHDTFRGCELAMP